MGAYGKWVVSGVLVLAVAAGVVASRRSQPRTIEELPVAVGKAEVATVQVEVVEVGTVEPEVKVDVKSALSGKVVSLPVREGDMVKRGQLLAAIEPDVNQAQTLAAVRRNVAQQEIEFADAEKDFLAKTELYKAGLIALEVHRAAETRYKAAREALEAAKEKAKIVESSGIPLTTNPQQVLHIVAPMDGVVIRRPVELGEAVTGAGSFNAGTVIATVADLSKMIVKAGVSEVDIGKVHEGLPVEVTLDAFPKVKFTGKVSRIAPAARLEREVKVYDVEVVLDAQGKELRTGMTANVRILGERVEQVLTVPVEAVFRKDDREVVYVRKTNPPGKAPKVTPGPDAWKTWFEERVVTTGLASLSRVEVVSGLVAGEEVALEDPTRPKKRDT
ncbi:MAG: efflux RND transporter periplasmic adaptor subunit [Thermoanaerobaculum sp.]|nr:efflux RND transporter periplasmic adaptor subunit [Thermoanaerobaculum sp.]MDW7966789.1 efflux RND transporter periplasmic adaptor subunit [Thermoanaerobaculum sp.]